MASRRRSFDVTGDVLGTLTRRARAVRKQYVFMERGLLEALQVILPSQQPASCPEFQVPAS
jgi:hypothetical protein